MKNQHSHLTSCSRICMNNATALHLLHQVREGECSCFGEVTLTEIKLLVSNVSTHGLQRNYLFQAQSCTHKLIIACKWSCLWMDKHTHTIANNKQMRFHFNAVKAQVLRVLLVILSVIYNVKRDVCALYLNMWYIINDIHLESRSVSLSTRVIMHQIHT